MRKNFIFIFFLFVMFSMSLFIGCGGSEEEVTEDTTVKDSTQIYQILENSRSHYSKALLLNEQSEPKSSAEEFESAVNQLSKVNNEALTKHIKWNDDYNELTKSVVQDYLISTKDIPDKSKVFGLAKRVNVKYEKNEQKSYSGETTFIPEDLPGGEGIKLVKNSYVEEYINYFQNGGRKYMDKWMYRLGKYSNLMRSILKENNAPEELIYLAMIESGLDPAIHSWAGAIGMWQFMPATGSSYGLYYDQYTDDKNDPEKSTDAAARHLKDLYRSFGDWYLALASYNAGPGRITSAMQKTGSSDFWTIKDYLPKETRNYIPQFIACALITIDPKAYGFNDVEYAKPIEYDRVIIKAQINVSRIAELCNTQVETIRELNPQLLQDLTPVFDDGYLIKIPKGSFKEFSRNYKEANDFDKYSFNPSYEGNEGYATTYASTSVTYKVPGYSVEDARFIISKSKRNLVFHTFGANDDLNLASIKYSVRPSDIRMWNDYVYGRYPKPGDSLSVWLTNEKYKEMYGVDNSVNEKKSGSKEITNDSVSKPDTSLKVDTSSHGSFQKQTNSEDPLRKDNTSILVNKEHKSETDNSNNKEITKTEVPEKKVTPPVVYKEKKTLQKEKKGSYQTYVVKKGDVLASIADKYDVDVSDIKEWNDLDNDKILVGQKLKIYSDEEVSTEKTSKKTGKKITYEVKKGDNLTSIADEFDVSVKDIKEWNDLDDDVIYSGQVLKLYSEKKSTKNETSKKKTTYTVKQGDNLTSIADNFDVTVAQLKEWNELDNDVIYSGQVLKIYGSKQTGKNKENTKLKATYHLVKKGETLAGIADKYDVTVADLKKWNKLKSDEILIGQKLEIRK